MRSSLDNSLSVAIAFDRFLEALQGIVDAVLIDE